MNTVKFISIFLLYVLFPNTYALSSPAQATNGMVVSEHYLATKAGLEILRNGGNAIDAAVAVGYALAVVDPCCGNIGGGGFMTIRFANGKTTFINFREKAPLSAQANMYVDDKNQLIPKKSLYGYAAVGVPGTVLGLDTALKKYGTLSRAEVMKPAIGLAQNGFTLSKEDINRLYYNDNTLKIFQKNADVAAIFLHQDKPFTAGEKLFQLNLARSLQLISDQGPEAFYRGPIAKDIVAASQKNHGLLTLKDFANYSTQESQPIFCTYKNYHIITSNLPSSGGITLCEILNILEKYPLQEFGYHSPETIYTMTQAMKYAYADRNTYLGDADFIKTPIDKLISKKYADDIQKKIKTIPDQSVIVNPTLEHTETTHYSVTDNQGNAVSVTYSLNGSFGACVIPGNTGILLNNTMDDFSSKPNTPNLYGLVQGNANAIAPGKRPLSSMAPTIITKNNKLFMVLGSPGGSRIITIVLQTILNVINFDMALNTAVDNPRFHYQGIPNILYYEKNAFSENTINTLVKLGYQLKMQKDWGAIAAILFNPEKHIYTGVMDIRRPLGSAEGY